MKRGDQSRGKGSDSKSFEQTFFEKRGAHFKAITALNRDIESKKEEGKLPKDEKNKQDLRSVIFLLTNLKDSLIQAIHKIFRETISGMRLQSYRYQKCCENLQQI